MDLSYLTHEEVFRHALALEEIDPATGHELMMRLEQLLDELGLWTTAFGACTEQELREIAHGYDA